MNPSSKPLRRVLFAPAAGPALGGGHLMRCLTLAEALAARGAECEFALGDWGEALLRRFASRPFVVHRAAAADLVPQTRYDALVLDDYGLSATEERDLGAYGSYVVVLEDLANRARQADLLIDPGYGRRAEDYHSLIPSRARTMVGPDFAILRPQFVQSRAAVMSRGLPKTPKRLFVSFGLSDVGGVAQKAIAAIRVFDDKIPIDVALASDALSAAPLRLRARTDPALSLHFDAEDVAELMGRADIAVGAGGVSTWERCCLGRPSVVVVVAANQKTMIEDMVKAGLLLAVDLQDPAFGTALAQALARLWPLKMRKTLSRRSLDICDGRGAERLADAVLSAL